MIDIFLLCLCIVTIGILIADIKDGKNVPESLTMVAMTLAALIVHYQFLREVI